MKHHYKDIKESYLEVKVLLEKISLVEVENLNTKVAEDLSLWGDDNYEFISKFIDKYNLDFNEFKYSKYFESEGELFNSGTALITLILLPFHIINQTIKLFYSKFDIGFNKPYLSKENKRTDLTFGDLITCKLAGKFCLRKDAKIEILYTNNKI